jgi:hypothetical protein
MSKLWPAKDPDEKLDYSHDFAPDLDAGETLVAGSTINIIADAGVTEWKPQEIGDTFLKIWLQGGTEGEQAQFTAHAVTSAGRVFEEENIFLPITAGIAAAVYPGGYAAPTPGNLVALYPEFGDVSAITIQANLDKAARAVDESWMEGDFGAGRMALAAHFMAMSGLGTSTEARLAAAGVDGFKSMASGSVRLERSDKASKASGFDSTRYGQEYKRLLRVNKGGPRVTGTALAAGADGDRSQAPTFPWGL